MCWRVLSFKTSHFLVPWIDKLLLVLCRCGSFLWQHRRHDRVPPVYSAQVLLVVRHSTDLHSESSHLSPISSLIHLFCVSLSFMWASMSISSYAFICIHYLSILHVHTNICTSSCLLLCLWYIYIYNGLKDVSDMISNRTEWMQNIF